MIYTNPYHTHGNSINRLTQLRHFRPLRHRQCLDPGVCYIVLKPHICISKVTVIGPDIGLSPERRQAILWTNAGILFIGTLGTKIQWNLKQNSYIFILENAFENVICEIAGILSRSQCVNLSIRWVLRDGGKIETTKPQNDLLYDSSTWHLWSAPGKHDVIFSVIQRTCTAKEWVKYDIDFFQNTSF